MDKHQTTLILVCLNFFQNIFYLDARIHLMQFIDVMINSICLLI